MPTREASAPAAPGAPGAPGAPEAPEAFETGGAVVAVDLEPVEAALTVDDEAPAVVVEKVENQQDAAQAGEPAIPGARTPGG